MTRCRSLTGASSTSLQTPPASLFGSPFWLGLLAAAALHPDFASGQEFSTATLIRFNTVCARCHEGECSGRLSFSIGDAAIYSHLRRYLVAPENGQAAPSEQELDPYIRLLEWMKLQCRLPAFPVTARLSWQADQLETLRNPVAHAYFIPLGQMRPGRYRAVMKFDRDCSVQAEAVSANIELADSPNTATRSGQVEIDFRLSSAEAYYLRLFTDRPAALVALEVHLQP